MHIFAAAIGVSALIAASAAAFTALKWLGAAYLVYVGARMLLSRYRTGMELEEVAAREARESAVVTP